MNKKVLFGLLTLVFLTAVGAGCSTQVTTDSATNTNAVSTNSNAGTSSEAVKEFTVTASNFTYDVKEIKVKQGDKVKVTLKNTEGFHDWKLDEFNAATVKVRQSTQAEVEFVASKAGIFEYYCSVGNHREMGMKGSLIVE